MRNFAASLNAIIYIFFSYLAILFFFPIKAKADGLISQHINVLVDDALYSPVNEIINQFIMKNLLIVNVRYVNNDYFKKNIEHAQEINLIITQVERKILEKNFIIKYDKSLGDSAYVLCKNALLKSDIPINKKVKNNSYPAILFAIINGEIESALLPYSMCAKIQNINIISISDKKIHYSIYIVNYLNNTTQAMINFFDFSHDFLKYYGIMPAFKQYSG